MAPAPVVTGLSPKEGTPGTKITVRGEFLGTKAQDLIALEICGIGEFLIRLKLGFLLGFSIYNHA